MYRHLIVIGLNVDETELFLQLLGGAKPNHNQVSSPERMFKEGSESDPSPHPKVTSTSGPFSPQQETPTFMATQLSKPWSYLQPPQFSLIFPLPNLHASSSIIFFSLLSLWWPLKHTKYKCVDSAM